MLHGGGGIHDALESLAAHPDDWLFRTAILQKALDVDRKRRMNEIEAISVRVGGEVAKALSKMFGG